MSKQSELAYNALQRKLKNNKFLVRVLRLNYELSQGLQHAKLYLAPDGLGGWTQTQVDTHTLALHLPTITLEEYQLLAEEPINTMVLEEISRKIRGEWEKIAFLADYPENPFWQGDI